MATLKIAIDGTNWELECKTPDHKDAIVRRLTDDANALGFAQVPKKQPVPKPNQPVPKPESAPAKAKTTTRRK